jgi:anti-sigma B factor antagonist
MSVEDFDLITVRTEPAGDAVVVHVTGELDLSTAEVADAELGQAVGSGAGAVIVNLDRVSFLGSTGLRVLLTVRERARDSGVALRLVGDKRVVLRPLEVSGLMPAFQVHASVPDAIASLGDAGP